MANITKAKLSAILSAKCDNYFTYSMKQGTVIKIISTNLHATMQYLTFANLSGDINVIVSISINDKITGLILPFLHDYIFLVL